MAPIIVSMHIPAPVARVFGWFTDIEASSRRISGIHAIEMLTTLSFGLGSRWRETREVLGHLVETAEMEVTAYDRNKAFTLTHHKMGSRIDTVFTFTPEDGGTCVDIEFGVTGSRLPAGVLASIEWAVATRVREVLSHDLCTPQAVVTERDRFESARRLAAEVAAARTLEDISTRLIAGSTDQSLYVQILDAAMALMTAHARSVQIRSTDDQLLLLADRNFHPHSAAFWHRVSAGSGSPCGTALRDNARVLVTDVETCEFMRGTQDLEECRHSGIRAVQSTPLRSLSGHLVGMISTHWRVPHTPTEDEFRRFDVLARQVADLIERAGAAAS